MTVNAPAFADGTVEGDRALALKMYDDAARLEFAERNAIWDDSLGVLAKKNKGPGQSWQSIDHAETPEAEEHQGGVEMTGQDYATDENVITRDPFIVVHQNVREDIVNTAHWDQFGPLAINNGRRVKEKLSRRAMIMAVLAAREPAKTKNGLTIHQGGVVVERTAASLAAAYPVTVQGAQDVRRDLNQTLRIREERNQPPGGICFIPPYVKEVLLQDLTIFDRNFQPPSLPNNLLRNVVGMISDCLIVVQNQLPSTLKDESNETNSKYRGDFTTTTGLPAALILTPAMEGKAAVGAMIHQGGAFRPYMHYDETKNVTFMKGESQVSLGINWAPAAAVIQIAA